MLKPTVGSGFGGLEEAQHGPSKSDSSTIFTNGIKTISVFCRRIGPAIQPICMKQQVLIKESLSLGCKQKNLKPVVHVLGMQWATSTG